jgi:hypothetical protein
LLWHALFCRSDSPASMTESTTWASDRDGRPMRDPEAYCFPRMDLVERILKIGANTNAIVGRGSIWTHLREQLVRQLLKIPSIDWSRQPRDREDGNNWIALFELLCRHGLQLDNNYDT